MPHIDPERLALFAMGEPVATPEEAEHLADCAVCVDDLAALRHVAVAGRASFDVGELETPPEVGLGTHRRRAVARRHPHGTGCRSGGIRRNHGARSGGTRTDVLRTDASRTTADVSPRHRHAHLGAGRLVRARRRRRARRLGGEPARRRDGSRRGDSLARSPITPPPRARAVVEEQADGTLAVRVALDADSAPDTYPRGVAHHRRRVGSREPGRAGGHRADVHGSGGRST